WAINLAREVDGTNNGYGWACPVNPAGAAAQANSDTLVIRRVGEDPIPAAALDADTMYVQSARFQDGQIFVGNVVPAGFAAGSSQTHQLVVNGYYVSTRSTLGNDVPS